MEKAYIILAHQNPEQLYRLLHRLDDGHAHFFIHIDKKVPLAEFNGLIAFGDKVQLVKRVVSNWAGFGLVQATINALEAIRQFSGPIDHVILLSGTDYPIKSNEFINRFFSTSGCKIFIESVLIPDHNRWIDDGGSYRVNKYFLGFTWYQRFGAKCLNFMGMVSPAFKRRQPGQLKPFAGSQWWMIDMYAVEYILDFIRENPSYTRFHRYTFAADELFFHGILLNATDNRLQSSIVNDSKRFINWENRLQGHPDMLQASDVERMRQSAALFARKFDLSLEPGILDMVDSVCLNERPLHEEEEWKV